MSASWKGHIKDLESQTPGLGAEFLLQAGGEWAVGGSGQESRATQDNSPGN